MKKPGTLSVSENGIDLRNITQYKTNWEGEFSGTPIRDAVIGLENLEQ